MKQTRKTYLLNKLARQKPKSETRKRYQRNQTRKLKVTETRKPQTRTNQTRLKETRKPQFKVETRKA